MLSFKDALARTLQYEGGYVNDPRDSGGETNYGITLRVARENGYTGSMRVIPMNIVETIYKLKYWNINKLDTIAQINFDIAEEIFDYGVNAGPATAAKTFQEALNLINESGKYYQNMEVDGQIGQQTISALQAVPAKRLKHLLLLMKALRAERYINICRNKESQEAFIAGWISRCFDGIN